MCRNKVLALIAGLCLVFLVSLAEAESPKGNGQNGRGSANSSYLNGKPFATLSGAISVNAEAIVQIKSEITGIQSELSKMADNFSELEQRVFDNEDDILALESRVNELAFALEGSLGTLASLQSELEGLQADVTVNQADILYFEAEIAKAMTEIQANRAETEGILADLRQELGLQKGDLDTFKEEFDRYKAASDMGITKLQNQMTSAIGDMAAAEVVTGESLAAILLLQETMNNINADLIGLNSSFITLCQKYNTHIHSYYDLWTTYYGYGGRFRDTGQSQ